MLTYRPYQTADLPAVRALRMLAGFRATSAWPEADQAAMLEGAVADLAGEVVGTALWRPERIRLSGADVPAGVLLAWASRPDHAAAGLATPLLAAALNQPEPALTFCRLPAGVTPAPAGFVPFTNGIRFVFPPTTPPASPDSAAVRPLTPDDRPAVEALAQRRNQGLAGSTRRQPADWDRWFADGDDSVARYGHEGLAGLDGFVRLHLDRTTRPVRVTVDEWLDDGPAACAGFFGLLAHYWRLGHTIEVRSLPMDRPYLATIHEFKLIAANQDRSIAMRAGLPGAFLPALAYQQGQGRLCLGVVDPLAIWPPTVTVTWKDGRLQDWHAGDGVPDLTLDIGALAAVALGDLSVTEAVYLGVLDGTESAKETLAGLWQPQTLYRYWLDQP